MKTQSPLFQIVSDLDDIVNKTANRRSGRKMEEFLLFTPAPISYMVSVRTRAACRQARTPADPH